MRPIADLPERGCVALDQPQQVGKHRRLKRNPPARRMELLRLVFDTAALRGQQESPPGACGQKLFVIARPSFFLE